jgi:hypothetical protein
MQRTSQCARSKANRIKHSIPRDDKKLQEETARFFQIAAVLACMVVRVAHVEG